MHGQQNVKISYNSLLTLPSFLYLKFVDISIQIFFWDIHFLQSYGGVSFMGSANHRNS